jgi:hypothetical protein
VRGTTSGSTVTAQQVTAGAVGLGGAGNGPQAAPTAQGAQGVQGVPGAQGVPPAGANRPANGAFPGGNGGAGNGGPPTSGVVKAVTGSGFTLTAADGSVQTVAVSNTTTYTVLEASSLGALEVGEQIQVNGTTGANGQVTATTIRTGVLGNLGGAGAGRGGQATTTTIP